MKRQILATPTAKQDRVAVLLAGGAAIKDAAAQCGVGERTVHGWLERDGPFKALVSRYRSKVIAAALGQLVDAAGAAVATLRACLGSDQQGGTRVRAAAEILDQVVRIRDTTEFEERLTELETTLGKQQRSTWKAGSRAGRR
jgi:hypothetical protein